MESTGTQNPTDALELIAGTRADLADRLVTPWWYHPALGLLVGALVASFAVDSMLVTVVALSLYGVGIGALTRAYRRLTGVWVNGLDAGRATRWGIWTGACTAVAMIAAVVLVNLGAPLGAVALGVVLIPVVVHLGHRFDDELRAELRER